MQNFFIFFVVLCVFTILGMYGKRHEVENPLHPPKPEEVQQLTNNQEGLSMNRPIIWCRFHISILMMHGMHQQQCIFAIQRFSDLRRTRSQGAVAVGGEVSEVSATVGGNVTAEYSQHGVLPGRGLEVSGRNDAEERLFFQPSVR